MTTEAKGRSKRVAWIFSGCAIAIVLVVGMLAAGLVAVDRIFNGNCAPQDWASATIPELEGLIPPGSNSGVASIGDCDGGGQADVSFVSNNMIEARAAVRAQAHSAGWATLNGQCLSKVIDGRASYIYVSNDGTFDGKLSVYMSISPRTKGCLTEAP